MTFTHVAFMIGAAAGASVYKSKSAENTRQKQTRLTFYSNLTGNDYPVDKCGVEICDGKKHYILLNTLHNFKHRFVTQCAHFQEVSRVVQLQECENAPTTMQYASHNLSC